MFSPSIPASFREAKILLSYTGMLKGLMAGSYRKHTSCDQNTQSQGLCNTVSSYLQTTPSREHAGYFSSNDASLNF